MPAKHLDTASAGSGFVVARCRPAGALPPADRRPGNALETRRDIAAATGLAWRSSHRYRQLAGDRLEKAGTAGTGHLNRQLLIEQQAEHPASAQESMNSPGPGVAHRLEHHLREQGPRTAWRRRRRALSEFSREETAGLVEAVGIRSALAVSRAFMVRSSQ